MSEIRFLAAIRKTAVVALAIAGAVCNAQSQLSRPVAARLIQEKAKPSTDYAQLQIQWQPFQLLQTVGTRIGERAAWVAVSDKVLRGADSEARAAFAKNVSPLWKDWFPQYETARALIALGQLNYRYVFETVPSSPGSEWIRVQFVPSANLCAPGRQGCQVAVGQWAFKAVTGITGPERQKQVEYEVQFTPNEVGRDAFYLRPGVAKREAVFTLYDDGWRLVQIDQGYPGGSQFALQGGERAEAMRRAAAASPAPSQLPQPMSAAPGQAPPALSGSDAKQMVDDLLRGGRTSFVPIGRFMLSDSASASWLTDSAFSPSMYTYVKGLAEIGEIEIKEESSTGNTAAKWVVITTKHPLRQGKFGTSDGLRERTGTDLNRAEFSALEIDGIESLSHSGEHFVIVRTTVEVQWSQTFQRLAALQNRPLHSKLREARLFKWIPGSHWRIIRGVSGPASEALDVQPLRRAAAGER